MAGEAHGEVLDALMMERAGLAASAREAGRRLAAEAQVLLRNAVRKVGRDGDLEAILEVERVVLVNERKSYANSSAMAKSLDTALSELDVAAKLATTVRDPEAYRAVDAAHELPRNRRGGLPRDEAQQFFGSHGTRLGNLDRGRLADAERRVLGARRANLRDAKAIYTALQHSALGIEPPPRGRAGPGHAR